MAIDYQNVVDQHALFAAAARDRALILVNEDGGTTSWNRGAELLTGWSQREVLEAPIDRLYPPADRAAGLILDDRSEATRIGQHRREGWICRKNGTEFLAMINVSALIDAEGRSHGFGYRIEDITDRKAAEAALETSARHLKSILDTIPDAMIVIDERGIVMSFSAAAERLFGYAAIEVIGRNVSMLMPPHDADRHDAYIHRYLSTGERRIIGIGRIVVGRKADGTDFPMELSIGEATSEGHPIFTGFVRDLTEQQRAELRLRELQSELIHVSRLSAMGTMASTLAHELNQPLTAIANYLEAGRDLLEDRNPEIDEMLREAITESAHEALRAGSIVRRLREFVARGEVQQRIERLPELIDDASRLALVGARERGVRFFQQLDPACATAVIDRVQIQQVLVNLLRNAIDSLAGAPVRDIVISTASAGDSLIRVTVSDTGAGLDPSVADRLFSAFTTTKSDGMGLGLSICRTIVEAHGGRIWYEPRPEGGALFHFTLIAAEQES